MRLILSLLLTATMLGCQVATQPSQVGNVRTHTAIAGHRLVELARTSTAQADRVNKAELDRQVEALLREYGEGVAASLWVGSDSPTPFYEWNSTQARPAASAIKTFHLIELFDAFAGKLEEPLPGAESILGNPNHPAMVVFERRFHDEIRRALGRASVRQVGMVMMQGKTLEGRVVEPYVYNAAANLVTAVLGGPEALTARIHKRDPAFGAVQVRRYMVANRDQGDNDAPATALAALYGRLATRKLQGIDARTMEAIYEPLLQQRFSPTSAVFFKDGGLPISPITSVHAGWWEQPTGPVVYVVMLVWITPERGDLALERLHKTGDALGVALYKAVKPAGK
jgi:hypothetical protein